ncbi:HET-domain-containing protein [Hypoxylon sp. NC1633]|nr:HET-domain-containing protein [Hypoxylon sp. NC1633]
MRLLNAHNLELVEFAGRDVPEYSILSHTWGKEEVTFEDLSGRGNGDFRRKLGFAKIEGCRRQTLDGRYEWFWVDTCCIDKYSSAELTEALNSMYSWYHRAAICYAYLSDVTGLSGSDDEWNALELKDSAFRNSRWFRRGWTLQELLAPRLIFFYDASWNYIDDRLGLSSLISEITAIGIDYIREPHAHIPSASTALKLSWASRRETLREEDIAYCLLGLMGVNMPLLYGEGGIKAFQRLQNEIMKDRYDHTILAWGLKKTKTPLRYWFGRVPLLASSPAFFDGWDPSVASMPPESAHYNATNLGLLIQLPIMFLDSEEEIALALLECCDSLSGYQVVLPLTVKHRPKGTPLGTRCRGISPFMVPLSSTTAPMMRSTTLYLHDTTDYETSNSQFDSTIDWRRLDEKGYRLADYFPPNKFHPAYPYRGFFRIRGGVGLLLRFRHKRLGDLLLLYCHNHDGLHTISDPVRIPGGYAVMALASSGPGKQQERQPYPTTAWELLLQPKFDKIDFEQLKASFQWGSTVDIISNSVIDPRSPTRPPPLLPPSEEALRFALTKTVGGEGDSILLVESPSPHENVPMQA